MKAEEFMDRLRGLTDDDVKRMSDALCDLHEDISACIRDVRAAFGAPGDYGYETREGRALFALYQLLPRISFVTDGNEGEVQ